MILPAENQSGKHHLRPSYCFADFVLDTDRGLLESHGTELALRPKSFEVLTCLVVNAGRLVSKDELLQAVWPDVVVTEDSLTQCLVDIRKTLGDGSRTLVRTVPRRGYILDTEVRQCPDLEPVKERHNEATDRRRPILAVAAFFVLALVSFWLLRAGPSTDASAPAMSGTVLPSAAEAGTAAAQDAGPEIARAKEHFLKGQFFFDRRSLGDLELAHENFRSAVDLDPSQADYWVAYASTTGSLAMRADIDWVEALELRRQALDRALTLDPLNAEAFVRLAQLQLQTGNAELTIAYLGRALELGQDNSLVLSIAAGMAFVEQRFDDAVALQRQAVDLDPIGFVLRGNLATYLFTAGYLDEAAREFSNASELNPSHAQAFQLQLIKIRILQERFEEAEELAMSLTPGAMRAQGLAYVHHARGNTEEAERALNRFLDQHNAYHAAQLTDLHAYVGRVDESFHWLGLATELVFDTGDAPANQFMFLMLQNSPFLEPLHNDPRWAEWLQETRRRIEQPRT